jgi:hypothetical protein
MSSSGYNEFRDFIAHQMRMSHIHQSAMLQLILGRGGDALHDDMAKATLEKD